MVGILAQLDDIFSWASRGEKLIGTGWGMRIQSHPTQTELFSGSKPKRSPVCNVEVLVRSSCEPFESSKSERERHDRPTWRRPCGRGAPRRARATAGGGRGGSPRRVLAGAGRTAIGEGLRGSRQKLIKPTCCPLTQANQRPSRLRTNGDGARLAAARVRVAGRTARLFVAERTARVRVTERAALVRVTERAARVRVVH